MDDLVSADWLAAHLGDVQVLDATMVDGDTGRDARAEYAVGHIPGARYLDLASLRETDDPLPNAFPRAALVAERLGALGIVRGTPIVLYDDAPWHSAARAWFILRHYGCGPLALLDGGLDAWITGGHPLDRGDVPAATPAPPLQPVRDDVSVLDEVAAALADGSAQVVDARSPARFTGAEADPHGAAPGHMPGAYNLPYGRLFDGNGRWKRGDRLAAAFADAGIDPSRPIISTCGSGITASVVLFALHLLGHDGSLYDGSWSEWGRRPDTAKALGPA